MGAVFILFLVLLCESTRSYGTMPDASQEGILKQYKSYEDVALFHYTVPTETTRATWEFASFQDAPDCPVREVMIYLQHGSFPVMAADNSSFSSNIYTERTSLHLIKTHSAFQPHDSTIFPVYNPLPGTWFVAAYLAPYEEKIIQQGIHHRCRYSIGSIALWTRAEQVDLIIPYEKKTYTTKKHFSYYKFFISDNVNTFVLTVSNCVIKTKVNSRIFSKDECIEYANMRDRALPKHNPDTGGFINMSQNATITFKEDRPYKSSFYYLLIVSSAEVSFELGLEYSECGNSGIYGKKQKNWYLSEEGLKYNATSGHLEPKEPKHGFQLFTVNDNLPGEEDNNFDLKTKFEDEKKKENPVCRSTFDFTRVDNVEEFSTNYFLQGKSWYTKWVTVTNLFPIMTRFETLDFTDLGGTINIAMGMDNFDSQNQSVEVYGCLQKGRQPKVENKSLICDEKSMIRIASDEPPHTALKLVPYPEPGIWYLGLQVRCVDPDSRLKIPCWGNFRFSNLMTSINIHIQPCGYRPQGEICGPYGVCVRSHKGVYMFTSCRCSSGYRGWTCDDSISAEPAWKLISDTLLLTLSNLFFLPAVGLALYYRLYTESLIYGATMFFSTFYHTCDQEMNHKHLPMGLEQACHALYVSKEVLQFCDFFCAIMSFWVTIISMAKLPERLVNFLHMLGVLLVSILVQYNRNGIQVFAVPIPLGILILIITLIVRSYKRRKVLKANRTCAIWLTLGIMCAVSAVLIFALIETTSNYQFVHSGWHVMIAMSLVFLLPYCRRDSSCKSILPKSESLSSEESELNEVASLDWTEPIPTISSIHIGPSIASPYSSTSIQPTPSDSSC